MSHILVGKTIKAVWLAVDADAIRFDTTDGEQVIAVAVGDCCSHTWIENVEGPDTLLGKVAKVEDINMPDYGSPDEDTIIAYYGCKITTNKGETTIDYRNSSNGAYGGELDWPSSSDRWPTRGSSRGYYTDSAKFEWKRLA
jgi:hypothetical protein